MADIADVEQAVADIVAAVLYPEGASQSSIVGAPCRIYRGWPNSATLNADLSAGVINVTVTTDSDSGRTTTRYLPRWQAAAAQPGATATTSGGAITVAGNPSVGDVIGAIVDGVPYAYRVQPGDSSTIVASNLAHLIQANRFASVHGRNISIPGARSVTARVVCDHAASYESRRQEKDLRIICWCATPDARDSIAAAIDAAIAELRFMPLPDGTEARIAYRNTASSDQAQNAMLYRRDLLYTVEYPTITILQQPAMLFGASELDGYITYG